jgi:hypothetical protein
LQLNNSNFPRALTYTTVWAIFIYKPVILKELIELYSKALTIKEIPDTREKPP